ARRLRLDGRQPGQRLVQGEQVVGALGRGDGQAVEVEPLEPAAALGAAAGAGAFDEDAAHGLGGRGEEVASAVPGAARVRVDQPQVRLVNQGGRLQRLAGRFVGEFVRGELTQRVVDQRQQLLRGGRVALLDGGQDARDVTHYRGV